MARIALVMLAFLFPAAAQAGYFEISANGSYYKYNNGVIEGVKSSSTSFRWGGGLAYRFLSNTSIELNYMNSTATDVYGQDTSGFKLDLKKTTKIENTSLNLVLDFADRKARFRPYVSAGGGIMNRKFKLDGTVMDPTTLVVSDLEASETEYRSASADFGMGLKIFVAESIALDASFNLYATDLDKEEIFLHYSAAAGLKLLF